MEDHSVYGYLKRRTTEELECVLARCLQEDDYVDGDEMIVQILRILEARSVPALTAELVLRARQRLLDSALRG